MDKIIGFLITKEKSKPNIDFFNVGLKTIVLQHADYYIYLWGIGDLENYKIDDKYSLSFPLHSDLLDRNVLISFNDEEIIIENDWLGSIPVFYNTKENIVSTLSNLCLKDKKIHKEGLSNFCEFGYSVFEQTIFESVKLMRFHSSLIISKNGFQIKNKVDPILKKGLFDKSTDVDDLIKQMNDYVLNIEENIKGDILLPTSGGYDSRILNYFIKDKSRIRSFTYGVSREQAVSTEVAHAKKISEIYKTQWKHIRLEEFNSYIDEWFNIYGFSTHLHGMYHIEFYNNILKEYHASDVSFLSGIFGDVWAGSISYDTVNSYEDIVNLGYTHGLNLDPKYLAATGDHVLKKAFFAENSKYFKNNKLNVVFTVRMKLALISFATQIPEYFGLPAWTPFLNFDIVKSTLCLPEDKRKKRVWQRDFFKTVGLDLENMGLISNYTNSLDFDIAKVANFEPINVAIMKEYIDEKRLHEINHSLSKQTKIDIIKNNLLQVPKVGSALKLLGVKNDYLNALNEYYVIKSIEKGLML